MADHGKMLMGVSIFLACVTTTSAASVPPPPPSPHPPPPPCEDSGGASFCQQSVGTIALKIQNCKSEPFMSLCALSCSMCWLSPPPVPPSPSPPLLSPPPLPPPPPPPPSLSPSPSPPSPSPPPPCLDEEGSGQCLDKCHREFDACRQADPGSYREKCQKKKKEKRQKKCHKKTCDKAVLTCTTECWETSKC